MADDAYTPGFVPSEMLQAKIARATDGASPPAFGRGYGPLA
jgi:hypothetical protein